MLKCLQRDDLVVGRQSCRIQWSVSYLRTDNPIPVDGTADPKDEEAEMTWWIFVDIVQAEKDGTVKRNGGFQVGGECQHFYETTEDPKEPPEPWMKVEATLCVHVRPQIPGGAFIEVKGLKPELPPGFEQIVPVRRVTMVGAPPHNNIKPGLYEINGASAEVRQNGQKLKIELTADSCKTAWELYRRVLQSEDSALIVPYAA